MTFIPDLFNIVFSNPILSNDDRMRRHRVKSNFGAKCLFLGKNVHWRRYVRSKWPVDAFWRQQINSGPDGKKVSRLPPLLLKSLTPGTMNLYWVSFSKKYVGMSDWWRSQVSAIPPFRKWPDPIDGTFARTFWPPSSKLNWKRPLKKYFYEFKLSKERFGILGGYLSLKGALWIFDFFLLQRQLLPFFPSSKVKHYHRM